MIPFDVASESSDRQAADRSGLVDRGGRRGTRRTPLGLQQQTDVIVHCTGSADVYLATSLVFDNGFETDDLSDSPLPVLCAP